MILGLVRPAILVQCCTLFWGWSGVGNGTPLAEPHSHPYDLSKYLRLVRIMQHPGQHGRKRVGLQDDFFARLRTPATGMAVASLDEVDRPLILGAPSPFLHLV